MQMYVFHQRNTDLRKCNRCVGRVDPQTGGRPERIRAVSGKTRDRAGRAESSVSIEHFPPPNVPSAYGQPAGGPESWRQQNQPDRRSVRAYDNTLASTA